MNFLIPAIISGIIIFVIFIINLIRGNSFIIILFRLIISFILIYGILLGIQYLFFNIFKIDLRSNEKDQNNVDIVVDDNIELKNENELKNEQLFNSSNERNGTNISNTDENIENISNSSLDINESISNKNNDEYDNISSNIESGHQDVNIKEKLKEKLGFQPTNEELAKAIRTVLKKDKDG